MKKQLQNQIVFIVSSIIIGIIVGGLDTFFGKVLIWLSTIRIEYFFTLVPFLSIAGMMFTYFFIKYGKDSPKGMSLVFETGHEKREDIPLRLIPFVMVGTWITHLFGASAGREGVAVQLGATVSNWFGRLIKQDTLRSQFIIIGIAAGFAGLFETPIAASFFALEVLVVGKLRYDVLFPTFIGAFVASTTSQNLGLEKFQFLLSEPIQLTEILFIKLVIIGLLFGLTGRLFVELLEQVKYYVSKILTHPIARIGIGGVLISVLVIVLGQGRYSGLGTNLIDMSLTGETIYIYDWLLKVLLTVLTLSVGFLGGEVTPLFSIGATLGVVLGSVFGLPIEFTAALGYASVFGSATNTLLAPIFIGGEVFGFSYLPYFVIVCVTSFVCSKGKSIYPLQKYI